MATTAAVSNCDYLILDAGPLLSLSPLRGLAKTYLTVPQVLDELKDRRAREHFEQLGLSAGVKVEVRAPDAASLAQVAQVAKKTGDYSVLSHADLCVLALTYALERIEAEKAPEAVPPTSESTIEVGTPDVESPSGVGDLTDKLDAVSIEPSLTEHATEGHVQPIVKPQDASKKDTPNDPSSQPIPEDVEPEPTVIRDAPSPEPIFDDPEDEDDGEGEWITPANVDIHKSRALDLLPDSGKNTKSKPVKHMNVACMTADFAMQNVLLHMGLNLVGVEGKRIDTVKTWVLRCHACFKLCQDSTRKFCPSCGNPTLLRASVTVSAPRTPGGQATMQVHLKKNFQHRLRGTIYSIPAPKPGSAKTGTGEGLILREDQSAYARATQKDASKRQREERKMMSNALERGAKGQQGGVVIGSWMDPDWVPEIMSVGAGGHGRSRGKGDMPTIGHGRKNPNERRRKK